MHNNCTFLATGNGNQMIGGARDHFRVLSHDIVHAEINFVKGKPLFPVCPDGIEIRTSNKNGWFFFGGKNIELPLLGRDAGAIVRFIDSVTVIDLERRKHRVVEPLICKKKSI